MAKGVDPQAPVRRPRVSSPDRRVQIIEAARKVFLANGLPGARTKDIAEAASVNEAILYRHFSSKEELFEVAVLEPLEELVAGLVEEASALTASGMDQVDALVEIQAHCYRVMVEIGPLIGVALFSDPESGRAFYRDRMVPLLDRWREAINVGLNTLDHRDVDADTVLFAVWGSYLLFGVEASFRGKARMDLDAVARKSTDLLLFGLSSQPPEPKPQRRATSRLRARST